MQQLITETEVKVFGDKLAAFGETLNDHEQSLLYEILMRAAAEEDVEGHVMLPPGVRAIPWAQVITQIRRVANQIALNPDQAAKRTLQRPYINHQS